MKRILIISLLLLAACGGEATNAPAQTCWNRADLVTVQEKRADAESFKAADWAVWNEYTRDRAEWVRLGTLIKNPKYTKKQTDAWSAQRAALQKKWSAAK